MKVSISQLAAHVGKSERTIERWIAAGKLQAVRRPDGLYEVEDSTMSPHNDIAAQLQALSERIDRLEASHARIEQGISEIKQRLDALQALFTDQPYKPIAPPVRVLRETTGAEPPAHKSTLPNGLVVAATFAELHNIPRTTVNAAIVDGRLPVVRGSWVVGRQTVKKALDAGGRAAFYTHYSGSEHFQRCQDCPHAEE